MQRSYKKKKYRYLIGNLMYRKEKNFKDKVSEEIGKDQSAHLPNFASQKRRCHFCSTKAEPHQTLCLSGNRNCFLAFYK